MTVCPDSAVYLRVCRPEPGTVAEC